MESATAPSADAGRAPAGAGFAAAVSRGFMSGILLRGRGISTGRRARGPNPVPGRPRRWYHNGSASVAANDFQRRAMTSHRITESQILDALRVVIDPDLHRDIVSLNFVRNVKIDGSIVSFDINL